MKKIIISLISIVLLSGAFCPICAQRSIIKKVRAGKELHLRTNFQSISNQDFEFPSPEEAAKVFAKGKEMLVKMAVESVVLDGISKQIDSENKQEFPYLLYSNKTYKQDLKHYWDFYKQIVWKENGIPDLTKAATAKAYLAFYYLIHNEGKPSSLQVGRIDEHFPFLGVYADSFKELQERFGNNDAYLWFTVMLYGDSDRLHMLPAEYTKQAEEIAKQMLYRDFENYGMTKEQADQWVNFATSWSNYSLFKDEKGQISKISNMGNWYMTISITPQNMTPYLVSLHEFQHVKDIFPAKLGKNSLDELTTSVKDVIIYDTIYRSVPNMEVVKNKRDTKKGGLNLGEIAFFFGNLSKDYKTDNYAELLLTPEASEYIEVSYDRFIENTVIQKLIEGGKNPNLIPSHEIDKLKKLFRSELHKTLENAFKNINR